MDSGSLPLRRHRAGPGRVVLVGGGPGDADLLTLRGRRELAGADVVVVDRLAPRGVLDELVPGVLILDVGKAPGRHPVPQHAINQLLIDHARAGRRVVRLKGGDPFLLGRGGEEVAACRAAGVPVEVVPGVTSAFAVPAAAGIPVTHRGLAKQVTVLSGHDAEEIRDWSHLARAGGTLVVLMGVAALPGITSGLLAAGMAAGTPVAVIEKGSLPDQQVTTGTVGDIAAIAEAAGVEPPAVIVIGDVAELAG
jgi:uroporphyrin-III C-methyltransferase/precorrin-2 dehydrogenase/sirohydrochlorin ferrochelatase